MAFRKVSTFSAYRSYQQITRVLLAVCLLLSGISVVLTCFLVNLFPLKEVKPMLVTFSEQQNQVVRIEPLAKDLQGTDVLLEKLACRYVELRETFDGVTENARLQELMHMSAPELWEAYGALIAEENPQSPFKAFQQSHVTRSVKIKSCFCLAPAAPDTYRIEWESLDTQEGQEGERKEWVTTLAITLDPREVRFEDKYINPIGFTVIHYAVAKKEN